MCVFDTFKGFQTKSLVVIRERVFGAAPDVSNCGPSANYSTTGALFDENKQGNSCSNDQLQRTMRSMYLLYL